MSEINSDDLQPRAWYFTHESAIYERIGFGEDGGAINSISDSDKTIAEILTYWKNCGEPVYRYFWSWSLPPVTFTSRHARSRLINSVELIPWGGNRLPYPDNRAYEHLPATWVESFGWVEVFHAYGKQA